MFYEREVEKALRFGDVLSGYITTTPELKEPILTKQTLNEGYNINVNLPTFSAIITPCCSIRHGVISLTPLIEIPKNYFDNPYLAQDLTRINREMSPQQAVIPHKWESLPGNEKEKRLKDGHLYAFLELFVYEKNDLLPKYIVHREGEDIETNYYMINFKYAFRLNCKKINAPKDAPLDSKYLQLSTDTRTELRKKIAYYYGRTPKQDEVLED